MGKPDFLGNQFAPTNIRQYLTTMKKLGMGIEKPKGPLKVNGDTSLKPPNLMPIARR